MKKNQFLPPIPGSGLPSQAIMEGEMNEKEAREIEKNSTGMKHGVHPEAQKWVYAKGYLEAIEKAKMLAAGYTSLLASLQLLITDPENYASLQYWRDILTEWEEEK